VRKFKYKFLEKYPGRGEKLEDVRSEGAQERKKDVCLKIGNFHEKRGELKGEWEQLSKSQTSETTLFSEGERKT